MDDTDKKILDWAEFVSTKFSVNQDGWVYSRDVGDLKHIRYESDYTGYNHWAERLKQASKNWNVVSYFRPKSGLDKMFADDKPTIRGFFLRAWVWSLVSLRKDSNRPDGQINGILTHWEEDGEYIALFQPRVGVRVIEFIRNNPDNEYARAIMAEMRACKELSWPSPENE